MIECLPRGVCSWDFELTGEGYRGLLETRWVTEQGTLSFGGDTFDIIKHGTLSGYWTMGCRGAELVTAQKSSPFTRTFHLHDRTGPLTLQADHAFGRAFSLLREGRGIARIVPTHPFTRRAHIETPGGVDDFSTVCFAFWLAVVTWRRRRRRN